jgi:hypothetical protein
MFCVVQMGESLESLCRSLFPALWWDSFLSENIGGDGDNKENTTKFNCRNSLRYFY